MRFLMDACLLPYGSEIGGESNVPSIEVLLIVYACEQPGLSSSSGMLNVGIDSNICTMNKNTK